MRLNKLLGFFAFTVAIPFCSFQHLKAQEKLDLDKCIQIALENNLDIQIAQNNVLAAKADEDQSKYNFFPSVNGSIGFDSSFGNNTDDISNTRTTSTNLSRPYIQAEVNLFNGLANHKQQKKSQFNRQASQHNVQAVIDNTKRSALGFYLQVITDKENIRIAQERLNLLKEQLKRAEKRAEAGVINLEDVFLLKSQIASEKLNQVKQNNALSSDKLNLLQLLQLDIEQEYEILGVIGEETEVEKAIGPFKKIHRLAINYSPVLKGSQLNQAIAQQDIKLAKTGLLPSLSFSAAVGSDFTSNALEQDGKNMVTYFKQMDQNFNQSIGLNLRVPIFDRFQNKTNIQQARIIHANADLSYKQNKIELSNQLQRAYLDVISAQETFKAAEENLIALEESFKYTKARYDNGGVDFYTYLESLNNKNRAEIDRVLSRYTFILQKKVLEIYTGS